ncbi:MAG: hypothetical protein AAGI07_19205 [Bacteroidota bacterium]
MNLSDKSKAFQEFYGNYFENLYLVGRGEVHFIQFYSTMKPVEKELALKLMRNAIQEGIEKNWVNEFYVEALGEAKDKDSIGLLTSLLEIHSDEYYQIRILKALWKINADDRYFEMLKEVIIDNLETYNCNYVYWLLDFKSEEALHFLFKFLTGNYGEENKASALRLLNYFDNNFKFYDHLKAPKRSKDYFMKQMNEEAFIIELLEKMKVKKL